MANDAERTGQVIESRKDFKSDRAGEAARWSVELAAAKKELKKWQDEGGRIVKRFLDKRESKAAGDTRLNLFTSNITTQRALMFGKTPKVDVSRRWQDPNDNIGRVCALMLERLLNTDVEESSDGYVEAIGLALDDRQLVGLGNVRLRYEVEWDEEQTPGQEAITHPETGEELAPAVPPQDQKKSEKVAIDYVHWRDQLWSPARVYGEVRWWAYLAYMTKDELAKRFGKKVAKAVPMAKKGMATDSLASETQHNDPWARAAVWEIWSKTDKKVYFYCEGCKELLEDPTDDPLGLKGFFPHPRPMAANVTTDQYVPRPDFMLGADLYNEIDYVSTRITVLERAVKCVGAYDQSAVGVQRLLTEACDNELVPVENWPGLAEKGGLQGVISWLPIVDVVAALDKLRDYRSELVKLLYEVTGMSDIMRGQSEGGATATEQALKARFASVRMQHSQDEFARFASEVLELKAEIIARHFDPDTIVRSSGIEQTADGQYATQAVQLLQSDDATYRIEVKPENLSITDFAQLKEERASFLQGMTMFLQSASPLIMAMPGAAPFLIEILKWGMSAFRGSASVEGIFDQAAAAMTKQLQMQAQQPPKPDPKEMVAKAKVEGEQQRIKGDMQLQQVKVQSAQQLAQIDLQKSAQKAQLDMQKTVQQMHLRNQAQVQQLAANSAPGVS